MNLLDHHDSSTIIEGYSQQVPEQEKLLKEFVSKDSVRSVLEIGFNAGHSSEIFLENNKNVHVVSFDLNEYKCVTIGKQFIDKKYPGRHELIIGNSIITVPEYIKNNPTKKFDIIFIDGGHTYEVAHDDLVNCKSLAHDNTLLIVDDTVNIDRWVHGYNEGPTRVWNEAKRSSYVIQHGFVNFKPGRGMAWGKYV